MGLGAGPCWAPWSDGKGPNPSDWFIEPNPYARTGPGMARDGKPKFDLSKFDPVYFDRLRQRVQKAGQRGIYVSVMLFQGWSSAKQWLGGRPWPGHPYHPDNNLQAFNGNLHSDDGPDLGDPRVRQRQAAYLRKVVDTINGPGQRPLRGDQRRREQGLGLVGRADRARPTSEPRPSNTRSGSPGMGRKATSRCSPARPIGFRPVPGVGPI